MDPTKIAQTIENVNSGRYSKKELIALFGNAKNLGVTDVMHAIEQKMRVDFPGDASRMFGAKDDEARALLEQVWQEASPSIAINQNKVRNGVKTGGGRIAGKRYIDVYLSYKTSANVAAFLALVQESPDSELVARVGSYRTGRDKFKEEKEFQMSEFNLAAEEFKRLLAEVLTESASR